jgi:phosphoglucosamine mutase
MRAGGFNLGGEQSGHVIMTDYGTTGDGLMVALQALAILKSRGGPASLVFHAFTPGATIITERTIK